MRTSILLLPALLGCDDQTADYVLNLVPVTAANQAPFNDLDSLSIDVEHASGVDTFDLSGTSGSPEIGGLSVYGDVHVAVRGYDGSDLSAFGRSPLVSLSEGQQELPLFVGEVEATADLSPLEEKRYGGALVASDDGRFFLFGGAKKPTSSFSSGAFKAGELEIYELSLASPDPDSELTFRHVADMPEVSNDSETGAGRVNHTATLLTGDHDDAGKILVTGGSFRDLDSSGVLSSAFLFDPDTYEIEFLPDMNEPRSAHVAVENTEGQVIIIGGFSYVDTWESISEAPGVEAYDPSSRTFEQLSKNDLENNLFPVYGAAASLGTAGVLYCGGFDLSGSLWTPMDGCWVVSNTGNVSETDPTEVPLIHATLVSIEDGQALLAGGITSESEGNEQGDEFDGLAEAWLYDEDANPKWKPVGEMNVGRHKHRAVPLPGGRALIAGGSTKGRIWPGYDIEPSDCIEIFDVETYTFTFAEGDSSCSAGLTQPTASPSAASHPLFGAVFVGGADDDNGLDVASVWLPKPE